MGQIQATASRHQEFAPRRGHFLEHVYAVAGSGQVLGGDEAGRSGPDDGNGRRLGHAEHLARKSRRVRRQMR